MVPRHTSSCTLVSSRTTATGRARVHGREVGQRGGDPSRSLENHRRPLVCHQGGDTIPALPTFAGKESLHEKRSTGSPLTTRAATTDVGPGTTLTFSPASHRPGHEECARIADAGIPASLTTATVPPPARQESTRSTRDASLCPCTDSSRSPCAPPAAMPMAERSALVRRVSSQQTRSAVARTSRARGDRSPKLPIGVATRTKRPGAAPSPQRSLHFADF